MNKIENVKNFLGYLSTIVSKAKSLMTHLDPDYTFNGINDPFLIITILRVLRNCINKCFDFSINVPIKIKQEIEKLIIYSMSIY